MYINRIKQQYYNYFSLDIDLLISLSAVKVWALENPPIQTPQTCPYSGLPQRRPTRTRPIDLPLFSLLKGILNLFLSVLMRFEWEVRSNMGVLDRALNAN